MPDPVKLSCERWDLLGRAPLPDGTRAGHNSLTTTAPIEIDGVTFLPAEYVPAEVLVAGAEVEWKNFRKTPIGLQTSVKLTPYSA